MKRFITSGPGFKKFSHKGEIKAGFLMGWLLLIVCVLSYRDSLFFFSYVKQNAVRQEEIW